MIIKAVSERSQEFVKMKEQEVVVILTDILCGIIENKSY
jgi:hypothetical protein